MNPKKMMYEELQKKARKLKLQDTDKLKLTEETVSIHLRTVDDLYNTFDCSPLESKMICNDVMDYILGQLDDFPKLCKIKLAVHIAEKGADAEVVRNSLENYFTRQTGLEFEKYRRSRKHWILSLVTGTHFLALCLIGAHFLNLYEDRFSFFSTLKEGIGIIGWVALWEPATYLLYGYKEDRNRLADYMKLYLSDIQVRVGDE